MDAASKIQRFLNDELLVGDDEIPEVGDDTPLLNGIVDSMALMRLVAFIEDEFEVAIDDVEITAANFRTVADIARLVEQRTQVP
jgi:acyl carrier protein